MFPKHPVRIEQTSHGEPPAQKRQHDPSTSAQCACAQGERYFGCDLLYCLDANPNARSR